MVSLAAFRVNSGSTLGAALSLAVTTMGAGILTLPSAYADAGIIPATLVLTGVAVFTVFSVDFIILGVDKLGRNSYEELTGELLGRHAEEFIRWMLITYNTGAAISYLVVVEDLVAPLQPLVTSHFPLLTTSKHTLLAVWTVLILPLSCVPTLGALHVSSFLAITATSLICCMIIFRYFVPGPTEPSAMTAQAVASGTATASWWWGVNPLLALPIIMFSFDCQSLVFQIYAGLDDMRRSNMMKVSVLSLIVTGVIHAAVGFFGYISNPIDVRDNIISNYDPKVDRLFTVGYVLYAAPIILAFVIMLFPIRDSIFILWYGYSSASVATHVPRSKDFTRLVDQEEKLKLLSLVEGEAGETLNKTYGSVEEELQYVVKSKKHHNSIETIPARDHLLISITLSTLCVSVALIVPGIVSVVALLGGLCSSTLCFTVPGLYRWQMHYNHIARCHSVSEWCMMVLMVVLGAAATVLGTAVSIQDVFFSH
ncbi:putative mitochondrial Amino acid permease-like protein [Leptomonas pyrrhocoris]|uniref:Putative mitochondrial Amino acid permease-like protein n=1 Tax=Leptomonas pyrrhocoris TaxID=157538 RepID=A0A0M9FV17_LEPPY|nr:putative mitochondrial Amino acid permease-like protein [Leptomonas pyrrhocoris]KPA76583.1 putative mitochondrial Amino acid permease-like protein [Leptomonas pyrrhocoris]|eukprot:XP_015655022.1 putative mitochondrial Amino acid permease-like protein [Leptomonas pyrrhocoris]